MHIEGFRSARNSVGTDVDVIQSQPLERYEEEIKSLQMEIERLKAKSKNAPNSVGSVYSESMQTEEKVDEVDKVDEDKTVLSHAVNAMEVVNSEDLQSAQTLDNNTVKQPEEVSEGGLTMPLNENIASENSESVPKQNDEPSSADTEILLKSDDPSVEAASDKMASLFSLYMYTHSGLDIALSSPSLSPSVFQKNLFVDLSSYWYYWYTFI